MLKLCSKLNLFYDTCFLKTLHTYLTINIAVNFASPKCGRASRWKNFPRKIWLFKIGKSRKSFPKSDFIGIFFREIGEFFVLIFQNQEIFLFRFSKIRILFQEIGKFMEMQEMMEEILEMRKMRDMLKNVGDILEMWDSPARCGRVDNYGPHVFTKKSYFWKLPLFLHE